METLDRRRLARRLELRFLLKFLHAIIAVAQVRKARVCDRVNKPVSV